ncbi:MAG: hypothetical protein HRT89_08160 [Lentisphaeria bacterium]|nr:hypothetical protein [Lentisphaeria bacterium]NQZ68028.1 hypothetical protein [Lentisphaeria bacterium]
MPSVNHCRMLFIGNSYTQNNNLPDLIANQLKIGLNIDLTHKSIVKGGASLRLHWNAGHAADLIQSAEFDYVVLQEQSTLPIKNARRFKGNVACFAEIIAQTSSKAALYMTWARQDQPEKQGLLSSAYDEVGKSYGMTIIPAGCAWEAFLNKYPAEILHQPDLSHPTLAGSQLAALAFYRYLFNGDVMDLPAAENSDPELWQKLTTSVSEL